MLEQALPHFIKTNYSRSEWLKALLIASCIAFIPIGRAVEVPTLILLIIGVRYLISNGVVVCQKNEQLKLFTIVFGLIWAPMLLSLINDYGIERPLKTSGLYLRFYFAGIGVIVLLQDKRVRELSLAIIFFIVCFWVVDTLIQNVFRTDVFGYKTIGGRLTGPFSDLTMPYFLVPLLPLMVFFIKDAQKSFIVILAILTFIVLVYTGSRSAWILVLAGITVVGMMAVYCREYRILKLLSCVFLISIISAGVLYHSNENVQKRIDKTSLLFNFDYESVDKASSKRLPIWESAVEMGVEKLPFGVGVRNFRLAFHEFKPNDKVWEDHKTVYHPHFFLLEVFSESGALGLLCYLLTPFFLLKKLFRNERENFVTLAVFAVTTVIVMFPFSFNTSFYSSQYSQFVWFLMAFVLTFIGSEGKKSD